MTKVTFVTPEGSRIVVDGPAGESVMHLALQNGGAGVTGECGGVLSCATCHVIVDEADFAKLEPMTEFEDEMIDGAASERTPTSRLSCQIILQDELESVHS